MITKGLYWHSSAPPAHPSRLNFLQAKQFGPTLLQWFNEPVQGRRYRLHTRNGVKTWYVLRKKDVPPALSRIPTDDELRRAATTEILRAGRRRARKITAAKPTAHAAGAD